MATLATSFLIGSSSFVQISKTCINAWMGSNFGQISPLTTELSTLERLKNRHIIMWPLWRLFFDRIFFILAGKKDIHESLDEFGFSTLNV